ncbi:MAG: class II glutamine amidotransferase [Promethearchaeota archaeon]
MNWKNYTSLPAPFKDHRVFAGCGISGYINVDGTRDDGRKIIEMLTILSERENGLGAGFAGYGIYPQYKEYYALHFLFEREENKQNVLDYLEKNGNIIRSESIPTRSPPTVEDPPITWRVFYDPESSKIISPDEKIVRIVMKINECFQGAFVMSSGKNMGVFKGNGWSHEIAEFYKIESYKAFMWLAHSRFPTNTPGWWGGAHPFNLLNCSVVHNGEITSYGTNKRYLDSFNYKCSLFTDTEVIAYLIDLLCRKHGLPIHIALIALSPPLFSEIEKLNEKYKLILKSIRATYRSAMLNGPFSIIIGYCEPKPMLIGLSDRKKLRPLVAGISENENTIYISSEEASFKRLTLASNNINFSKVWHPRSGTAIIATLKDGLVQEGREQSFENIKLTEMEV